MITIVFGKPRAGKTTYAAMVVQKNKRKLLFKQKHKFLGRFVRAYDHVFSNEPTLQDTSLFTVSLLGKFPFPQNSLVIIDEAGIELNNRNFKNLSNESKRFAAMHGHMRVDVLLLSQHVDIDLAYRSRCHSMILMSNRGTFSLIEPIAYSVDVDNERHELIEAYSKRTGLQKFLSFFLPRGCRLFYRPPWYKYFDSYTDDYPYPIKEPR